MVQDFFHQQYESKNVLPRKLTCHPPKRTISIGHNYIFQPSFLRRYVSFQGGYFLRNSFWHQNYTQEVLAIISYHFKHRGSFWMMINPTSKNGETFVNQPYKKGWLDFLGITQHVFLGRDLDSIKKGHDWAILQFSSFIFNE